jgi:predicted negative regulator of RcsB-dependent stress response
MWQNIFASEIKITAITDDQGLSVKFSHEIDVFPVLSYENKHVIARFYRSIQSIKMDTSAKKIVSVEYLQKDKRAIKINLVGHACSKWEAKIGKTQSTIKLYSEKQAPGPKQTLISTCLGTNSMPIIQIPCCFDSLAVFKRGSEIWIAMTGDTQKINLVSKDKVNFRRIKCQNAFVIACQVGKLDYAKLQYGSNQDAEILLAPTNTTASNSNNIEYRESKDRHTWKMPSNYQTCTIYDEKTDEYIFVHLIKDFVFGTNKFINFEHFDLQNSLQGLVFTSKLKNLPILYERNEISVKKSESEDSTIPLESSLPWYYEGNFLNQKQALESILKTAETDEEKYTAKKRLASLHFSKGQYHETSSLLESVSNHETFSQEIDTQLLSAVANYMIKEIKTAKKMIDLIHSQTKKESLDRELLLWTNIIKGNDLKKSVLLDLENFISEYHDEVYWNLVFNNLEQYLQEENITDSKDLLSKLRSPDEIRVQEKLSCFKARLDYQIGNKALARKALEALDKDVVTGPNKIMIKTNLTKMRYEDKEISLSDAITELENCMLIREDSNLEKSLLLQLADLYNQKNDLVSELRTLKHIENFLDLDLLSSQRMTSLYEKIFLTKDCLSDLEPFARLALFYEFEDLMPMGNMGDKIALSMANDLINLDLLDQAEAILEHQIKHRTVGAKKEKLVENLSCIFLANHKAEKALSLLNSLPNENDSFEKHQKRLQLKAIASLMTENYELAIQYVQHDTSQEGLTIKKEILFKADKWKEYIALMKPQLLSLISNKNSKLSPSLEQDILRFVISCTILQDTDLIKMLAADIAKTNDKFFISIAHLLSLNPLKGYKEVENIQQINQLNDILAKYKSEFWHQEMVQN